MNQQLSITIFIILLVLLLPTQATASEVGESSSRSKCSEYSRKIVETFGNLQVGDDQCDATFIVGDKRIRVHKVVMSAASPYFEAMFRNMRESLSAEPILLRDLDAEVFGMIIGYIYTGRITICDSNIVALLEAASYLQMTNVKAHCCAYMKKEVNAENCIGIKYIADKYSCSELSNYASDFTLGAFEEVVKSAEFLELTEDQLIDIISDDELTAPEVTIYESVMRWIRYQDDSDVDRSIYLPTLMEHVRFPQIQRNYLVGVTEDLLIQKCPKCLEYVKEANDYLLSHLSSHREEDESSSNERFKPRRTDYLFAVGGHEDSTCTPTSSAERYDPRIDKWTEVASMIRPRAAVSVVELGNILYAPGGFDGSTFLSSIETYDTHTDKWTDNGEPLEPARTTVSSIAILNGMMYVIGGYGDNGALNSVAKCDPHTSEGRIEWIKCKPLRPVRYGHAVVVLDGYIYVLGGIVNGQTSNTVERYDPTQNEWHLAPRMIVKRYSFGSVAHGLYLYAVGGVGDDLRRLNRAERYNPHEDNPRWELISPMTEDRSSHGLAVANGLLYAAGGRNSKRNSLNTVEVYDPTTNTWSGRAPMLHARNNFGLAAMRF